MATGWFRESVRHSLARRGISTSLYMSHRGGKGRGRSKGRGIGGPVTTRISLRSVEEEIQKGVFKGDSPRYLESRKIANELKAAEKEQERAEDELRTLKETMKEMGKDAVSQEELSAAQMKISRAKDVIRAKELQLAQVEGRAKTEAKKPVPIGGEHSREISHPEPAGTGLRTISQPSTMRKKFVTEEEVVGPGGELVKVGVIRVGRVDVRRKVSGPRPGSRVVSGPDRQRGVRVLMRKLEKIGRAAESGDRESIEQARQLEREIRTKGEGVADVYRKLGYDREEIASYLAAVDVQVTAARRGVVGSNILPVFRGSKTSDRLRQQTSKGMAAPTDEEGRPIKGAGFEPVVPGNARPATTGELAIKKGRLVELSKMAREHKKVVDVAPKEIRVHSIVGSPHVKGPWADVGGESRNVWLKKGENDKVKIGLLVQRLGGKGSPSKTLKQIRTHVLQRKGLQGSSSEALPEEVQDSRTAKRIEKMKDDAAFDNAERKQSSEKSSEKSGEFQARKRWLR